MRNLNYAITQDMIDKAQEQLNRMVFWCQNCSRVQVAKQGSFCKACKRLVEGTPTPTPTRP